MRRRISTLQLSKLSSSYARKPDVLSDGLFDYPNTFKSIPIDGQYHHCVWLCIDVHQVVQYHVAAIGDTGRHGLYATVGYLPCLPSLGNSTISVNSLSPFPSTYCFEHLLALYQHGRPHGHSNLRLRDFQRQSQLPFPPSPRRPRTLSLHILPPGLWLMRKLLHPTASIEGH